MITAQILLDSISLDGVRITSFILTYPRFIHSEFMTHRVFSRNAASSRAIPVKKMIEDIRRDPAMPVFWGKNQSGMQAKEELGAEEKERAKRIWIDACDSAIGYAEEMMDLGLHKQIANRILEPWFHMRTVMTATEFENFYGLRRHPDAQPEFKVLADMMWTAQQLSMPTLLDAGDWHLPFVKEEEWGTIGINLLKKFSTARCCRVSYLNVDGSNPDTAKDIVLHDGLMSAGHMSPFEHAATPLPHKEMCGNFRGWKQYRKFLPNEEIFQGGINKNAI